MSVSGVFLWFLFYSFLGWLFEVTYCIIKSGQWENRGFLYGPVCPIYGVGGVSITLVYQAMTAAVGHDLPGWQVFLVAFLGSIPLEYGTSWLLEVLFHAYWWDYSEMPLNLNGRVCLPASLFFGVAGMVIVFGPRAFLVRAAAAMPKPVTELLALLAMALLAADITLTVSMLTRFAREVALMEERLNSHMESFVATVQDKAQDMGQRLLEERERFSVQSVQELPGRMSGAYRLALRRVQGFRMPGRKGIELVNAMLNMVKKSVKRK